MPPVIIAAGITAAAAIAKSKMDANAAKAAAEAGAEVQPSSGGDGGGGSQWVGPAIGAAGTVAGAYLQSRSQNKATDVAAKSTAEALAFQKSQVAGAMANYQQRLAQYNAGRTALMQRYGIDIGAAGPMGGVPMSPGQPVGGGSPPESAIPRPQPSAPGVGPSSGATIGEMIQPQSLYGWDKPNFGLGQG